MHLSGHIAQDLETCGLDEGYLALPNEFQQVVRAMESLDGNYLLEYSSRGVIIRSGSAEMGLRAVHGMINMFKLPSCLIQRQRRGTCTAAILMS
jgi:hypothetical protein